MSKRSGSRRADLLRAAAALVLGALLSGPAQAADPIRVYAAGSLGGVMPKLIAASGVPAEAVAAPVFGAAGLLRKRLLSGEAADLFASADLAQPQAVAAERPGALVVPFARNRMCVAAPAALALTPGTVLERMLDPTLRLATSTPGADPGGDYAQAVFARADALRPGATAALRAKALQLLGGPNAMTPQPGHSPQASVFLAGQADLLLYYCSGVAPALQEVPGLTVTPVPDALEVDPVYGLAVLSTRPEAARLALFMLSAPGQAILAQGGLLRLVPGRDAAGRDGYTSGLK